MTWRSMFVRNDDEEAPRLMPRLEAMQPPAGPTKEDLYASLAAKAQALKMPEGYDPQALAAAQEADRGRESWRETGDFVTSTMLRKAPQYQPQNVNVRDYLQRKAMASEDLQRQGQGLEMAGQFEKARRSDEMGKAKLALDADQWGKDFGLKQGAGAETGRHNAEEEKLAWARLNGDKNKAAKDAADKATESKAKSTVELRKELQNSPVYKPTQDLASAYRKVSGASDNPAGDLGLIYGYMRLLDPGSSVKEGEFALAANSGSFGTKVQNAFAKVAKGDRLTPEQRTEFKGEATKLWGAQASRWKATAAPYREHATKMGINPDDVDFPLGMDDGADISIGGPPAAAPVRIASDADFDRLPSGAEFIDPEGVKRRKP